MLANKDKDREFWKEAILAALPPLITALPELIRIALGRDECPDLDDSDEESTEDDAEVSFRVFVKRAQNEQPR